MPWTNEQARDLVIRTLIGESNGTPEGMTSVAHVIKNRADSGAWGDPTKGGLTRTITAPKQFSIWNPGYSRAAYLRSIPPTDAQYQRAAAIVDGVFGNDIPDTTGGATHYHTPAVSPDWSAGVKPIATIGGHLFYKMPLTASNTAGTAVTGPSSVGMGSGPPLAPLGDAQPQAHAAIADALAAARRMLGKNEVPDREEIIKYLHDGGQDLDPHKLAWCASFVSATLQRAGLPVPTQVAKGSLVGPGANARNYLTYGTSVDDPQGIQAGDILVAKNGSHVGFAEGPMRQGINGPEVQLLAGNEADNTGRYRPGSYTNPETGAVANRAQVGMVGERWVPLSDYIVRRAPTPETAAAPAPAADVPASQAQPVAAVAPPGSPPIPGSGQNPSAGFVGPGSDKYSVISGMTTGTSHNPQLTTAANWGNLFGGGSPAPPPAAAPAAATTTPVAQPATAPTPPLSAPLKEPPGSPLSSVVPNWGTGVTYNPEEHPSLTPDAHMPFGGGGKYPAATPGQPSMGFPAMTNPFGEQPAQVSQVPGSMLASAQNLIKLLFPSNVG
jgi:N-acetylmuramoyl-L-alanine amidase